MNSKGLTHESFFGDDLPETAGTVEIAQRVNAIAQKAGDFILEYAEKTIELERKNDEQAKKVDALQRNLNDLIDQVNGVSLSPSGSAPTIEPEPAEDKDHTIANMTRLYEEEVKRTRDLERRISQLCTMIPQRVKETLVAALAETRIEIEPINQDEV